MKKVINILSHFLGMLTLLSLPMTCIDYNNSLTGTKKVFSFIDCIFGYSDYNIKFNVIIFLLFILFIISGLVSYLFKVKSIGYLVSMISYLICMILSIFIKNYFLFINTDYKFNQVKSANSSGYGILVIVIILALGAYFSYVNMIDAYEKEVKNKKTVKN